MQEDDGFITSSEYAEMTRRTQEAVRTERHRGLGPKAYRVGGRVLYKRSDVDAWLEQHVVINPQVAS